mmetsp:Transcript_10896/g.33404  ORF Transcript_10896/g.33404 Transcript_10896/m.33404 type:complete len:138 (-) Transcript_10896:200-613(-)
MRRRTDLSVKTRFAHLSLDIKSPNGKTPRFQMIFPWSERPVSLETLVVDLGLESVLPSASPITPRKPAKSWMYVAALAFFFMLLVTLLAYERKWMLGARLLVGGTSAAAVLYFYVTREPEHKLRYLGNSGPCDLSIV